MNAAVILRSVNDASCTVTRLGTVFYSVRHDVLTQVSTGEGLRTFRLNIKVPSSWTVDPEDEGKLHSLQGQMSQMRNLHQYRCENFTTTNCCPETSARNYQSTLRKIPKERNLIYTVKSRHCGSVTFSAISVPRKCTD